MEKRTPHPTQKIHYEQGSVYVQKEKEAEKIRKRDVQPRDTHEKQTVSYRVRDKKNIPDEFRIVMPATLLLWLFALTQKSIKLLRKNKPFTPVLC